MFTDMVGYTALAQQNESETMRLLEEHRRLIRPLFVSHGGREIKTIGDAFLVEFQSALDAVLCAVAIQQMMHDRKVARGEPLSLRIGIHVGDVVESGSDILGDAVNIASRIEPLAAPGGVCISEQVYDQIRNKSELPFVSLGEKSLKNVSVPIAVYAVQMPWEKSTIAETIAFPTNRVAILPFTSFSSNPDDAYFADGVTDEIISAVAGISGLSVISRTSVVRYKGTTKGVEEIGRELKVGSILEGTFKKAGNKIRVTTQLINVAEDKHLWAQNYDRNLDDVFEIQSDIAKQVADALRVRILMPEKERIEKKPTESTTAYALYLKGRYYLNKRGLEDLKKALEYFELAVHEDPDFALGFVGISDCCAILRANWGDDPEANLEKAKMTVGKALELDAELAEALASRAMLLFDEYDFRQAEEEFRKTIQLKPSYAIAHMWYFILLNYQMRWDEAQGQIEKALELDPLSPIIHFNHGAYYTSKREYSRAIEPFRRAIELGYAPAHGMLAWSYGRMKMIDVAKREYSVWVELNKDSVPLAQLYADMSMALLTDDKKTVSKLLLEEEAHFHDERGPGAFSISAIHFYLGEKDMGFEWLEKSYSKEEFALTGIQVDEFLDGVRSDPRYLDLVKRLGLAQTPQPR
jgi:TolB-like protein